MAMLGLCDVMPVTERALIGKNAKGEDVYVDVTGLSGEVIWKLLARYPDLFSMMAGGLAGLNKANPAVLADIIAASTREFDNKEATERARDLPIGAQTNVLRAMGRVTFPDGFGPFLESLKSASTSAQEAVEVVIKAAATTSQQPPKNLDPPETPQSGS